MLFMMQWQFKGAPGNAEKGVNKFLSTGKWCFVLFCSVMLCYVCLISRRSYLKKAEEEEEEEEEENY
jgi:hypothetical protein